MNTAPAAFNPCWEIWYRPRRTIRRIVESRQADRFV